MRLQRLGPEFEQAAARHFFKTPLGFLLLSPLVPFVPCALCLYWLLCCEWKKKMMMGVGVRACLHVKWLRSNADWDANPATKQRPIDRSNRCIQQGLLGSHTDSGPWRVWGCVCLWYVMVVTDG
jgi:hypothetical protein